MAGWLAAPVAAPGPAAARGGWHLPVRGGLVTVLRRCRGSSSGPARLRWPTGAGTGAAGQAPGGRPAGPSRSNGCRVKNGTVASMASAGERPPARPAAGRADPPTGRDPGDRDRRPVPAVGSVLMAHAGGDQKWRLCDGRTWPARSHLRGVRGTGRCRSSGTLAGRNGGRSGRFRSPRCSAPGVPEFGDDACDGQDRYDCYYGNHCRSCYRTGGYYCRVRLLFKKADNRLRARVIAAARKLPVRGHAFPISRQFGSGSAAKLSLKATLRLSSGEILPRRFRRPGREQRRHRPRLALTRRAFAISISAGSFTTGSPPGNQRLASSRP
jgi:hypothetical protein